MSTISTFKPNRILSAANAADLIDWICFTLDSGAKILLIDLGNVPFMDSTGLGSLVTALKMVQHAQGRLALCSLTGQTQMLFEISGMGDAFEIYEDASQFQQALAAPILCPDT